MGREQVTWSMSSHTIASPRRRSFRWGLGGCHSQDFISYSWQCSWMGEQEFLARPRAKPQTDTTLNRRHDKPRTISCAAQCLGGGQPGQALAFPFSVPGKPLPVLPSTLNQPRQLPRRWRTTDQSRTQHDWAFHNPCHTTNDCMWYNGRGYHGTA